MRRCGDERKDLAGTARKCAERLPAAELTHPFGPDWEVFKAEGLVTDSYRLVVGNLPKSWRPVDPGAFDRRTGDRARR
ncbi:hypothetical protein [Nonomuraea diastatica]|uniref:Uncharacterized protein n=1 Tax=Nonomuraea diastatica TaxID=1848329 RepID=A0A4V2YCQ6_9ACTN|nr:hypothetical protein [Nonomuraea diastatica]TDD12426.1 hypothetical protein E1294_43665 [Nonomuraea diastatica]